MLAELFDITQDKEGIFDFALLNQMLKRLILEHKAINLGLNFSKWKPDYQIGFKR
jgi:hypothetical protein